MIFTVGLTGGIGSGKTEVSNRFAQRGINIVDADLAARKVVWPGTPALTAIGEFFGKEVINTDGLDRPKLRKIVFTDATKRLWLENLLHPLIGEFLQESLATSDSKYAILVSPLLLETSQAKLVNRILLVDAPERLQIKRVVERDNNTESQVQSIIATQLSRNKRLERSDDVIVNEYGLNHIEEQVENLHQRYLQLSNEHDSTK